jgi:hypothetical protein
MQGKHNKLSTYALALAYREWLRWQLRGIVNWSPLESAEPGCTAVVGVCSRLPGVLDANLKCLNTSRWPGLRGVIAVVDGTESALPEGLASRVAKSYPDLNIRFLYYSRERAELAERLRLPYVFSWLSWCIGIRAVTTEHLLLHDYDALVLGGTLRDRHVIFAQSGSKAQGIAWYQVNGVEPQDQLVTTFEAFFDTAWLRSLRPLDLFNKLRIKDGRSIDFDTTLDAQDRYLSRDQRSTVPMNLDELVHPSQMIHQYTMFRRQPNAPLPCFSIPMIPFFSYLSGNHEVLERAIQAISGGRQSGLDLVGDGTIFNLSRLDTVTVDWVLKQMVQGLVALGMDSDSRIYDYGTALYRLVRAADTDIWKGDFTASQRAWISSCEHGESTP